LDKWNMVTDVNGNKWLDANATYRLYYLHV
jgi:hypothetical protein